MKSVKKILLIEMKRICDEFLANPSINPETGRRIKLNGPVYKRLINLCGLPPLSLLPEPEPELSPTPDISPVTQLPLELLVELIEQLPYRELVNLCRSNLYLNNICKEYSPKYQITSIFQQTRPKYQHYYKGRVLQPYIGFRFIKLNSEGIYDNYKVIDIGISATKRVSSAKAIKVNMMGVPINNDIITIRNNHGKWQFSDGSGIELGLANDEGIKIESLDNI